MSIVTRGGDNGETSLLYGGRVPKDDLHTEAYGTLDEAISALGLARALTPDSPLAERILALQRELFTVGAELATQKAFRPKLEKHFATVDAEMVLALETEVHVLEAKFPLPDAFILPGGSAAAAALDLARSMIRRAERCAVALLRKGALENQEVIRYLNRCSDLLFMLARQAEAGATTTK